MPAGGVVTGPRPDPRVLVEVDRLAVVEQLVPRVQAGRLDDLVSLAARLLRAQSAQISLLGQHEQFVAAAYGPGADRVPRHGPLADSLCTVTVSSGELLVVEDAATHPWVGDLPPVTSGRVGAYLGVVLSDEQGHALGSLCVYDDQPRHWSRDDVEHLQEVSRTVLSELARIAAAPEVDAPPP